MTTELDTGFPGTRQIQTLIREKQTVELKLLTGDLLIGQLRWQDPQCVCISTEDGSTFQVWMHAIAFLKRRG